MLPGIPTLLFTQHYYAKAVTYFLFLWPVPRLRAKIAEQKTNSGGRTNAPSKHGCDVPELSTIRS